MVGGFCCFMAGMLVTISLMNTTHLDKKNETNTPTEYEEYCSFQIIDDHLHTNCPAEELEFEYIDGTPYVEIRPGIYIPTGDVE
jgi:hypothetical protein